MSRSKAYVAANVLIHAIKRAGPQFDTEKLVDILEGTRNLDLGLGTSLSFGRAEHQASHKIWGTALDENGKSSRSSLNEERSAEAATPY